MAFAHKEGKLIRLIYQVGYFTLDLNMTGGKSTTDGLARKQEPLTEGVSNLRGTWKR